MTKQEQLEWNKVKKVSTFGKKKSCLKKKSKKVTLEKVELSNDYYNYLHNSNQKCVICGCISIEIHHITDIKTLPNEPRRVWNRVVTLCPAHHKNSKDAIHILSKKEFYSRVMSFEKLMENSDRLYKEYLEFKG